MTVDGNGSLEAHGALDGPRWMAVKSKKQARWMAGSLTGHGVVLGLDLAVDVAGVLGTSPLAVEVGLDGHVCGGCVEVAGKGLVE